MPISGVLFRLALAGARRLPTPSLGSVGNVVLFGSFMFDMLIAAWPQGISSGKIPAHSVTSQVTMTWRNCWKLRVPIAEHLGSFSHFRKTIFRSQIPE